MLKITRPKYVIKTSNKINSPPPSKKYLFSSSQMKIHQNTNITTDKHITIQLFFPVYLKFPKKKQQSTAHFVIARAPQIFKYCTKYFVTKTWALLPVHLNSKLGQTEQCEFIFLVLRFFGATYSSFEFSWVHKKNNMTETAK